MYGVYLRISNFLPVGILKHVSQNNRWSNGRVVTMSNVIFEKLVLTHYFFQMIQVLIFRHCITQSLPIETVWITNDFWDWLFDQLFNWRSSTLFQHCLSLLGIRADMSIKLRIKNLCTRVSVGESSALRFLMVAKSLPHTLRFLQPEESKRFCIW